MRDKRPVDELSIEELERILATRKRALRMKRHERYEDRRIAPMAPTESEEDLEEAVPATFTKAAKQAREGNGGAIQPTSSAKPEILEEVPASSDGEYFDGAPQFEEELEARRQGRPMRGQPSTNSNHLLWNRGLVVVEVIAVAGLLFLLVGLFQSFQDITAKTGEVQAQYEATARAQYVPPTPTPLINLAKVVLPSGHTFQDNQAVFNLDEVPLQYRDQFQSYVAQLPVSRPTPSPEGPTRIRISKIGVDSAVVYGDDWEALKLGVGHHWGSANPGQRGNMVLSAHNDVYGELFRYLDALQPGDEIVVSTRSRDYTYVVQPQLENGATKGHKLVFPTDTWVLGTNGENTQLTLISCYPYRKNNRRIVVFALLKQ
jgi:sortase A